MLNRVDAGYIRGIASCGYSFQLPRENCGATRQVKTISLKSGGKLL
jgi:hypothetical protein